MSAEYEMAEALGAYVDEHETTKRNLLAAEAQVERLTKALERSQERWLVCNQLLRTAQAIADREADYPNTTNWTGFLSKVSAELQHNPFAVLASEGSSK